MSGQSGNAVGFVFKLDKGEFAKLTQRLNELSGDKAGKYVARALNKTAVSARVVLVKTAQESYTVKQAGFASSMGLKRATSGNLQATLHSEGSPLSMKSFRYSFKRPNPARADIVNTGLKDVTKYGNKAFVGKGAANGHIYVRTGKPAKMQKHMKRSKFKATTGKDIAASREALEKLFSKSIPYMIGSNERVWSPTRPKIESDLKKYMEQQIAFLLK